MFYQTFLSSPVKRSMIISNKHSIHKLPHELLKNLRLRILGIRKGQEKLKTLLNYNLVPSLSPKINIVDTGKKTPEK